jgi:hypothetical protein
LAQKGVVALFVVSSLFSYSRADLFAALALRHRIALSGEARVFVDAGGLMSYGPNETEAFRQVGRYTGRIDTPPGPTTHSFEPRDFPETARVPAIGGLLRLRFGLRGDRLWPEGDFGRFVSGPGNPVSPMQIDLG